MMISSSSQPKQKTYKKHSSILMNAFVHFDAVCKTDAQKTANERTNG